MTGEQPKVGTKAPVFSLKNLNNQEINLADYKGKTVLISVVPDIDTRVCSLQTKRFNQEAAKLDGVQIITISITQLKNKQIGVPLRVSKWKCFMILKTHLVQLMVCIFQKWPFSTCYFVIDPEGTLVYEEIVSEVSSEPDYQQALESAKSVIL